MIDTKNILQKKVVDFNIAQKLRLAPKVESLLQVRNLVGISEIQWLQ